ncbi:Protein RADIALIS-like 6 [Vigna angularis]|uniref:Protein RADIALIS-like 6 n=1 Tax=Phaseolus angularis TaxID=3914 RepID=A0A8T0KMF6_PHAAN|nr:Protein RADIALIS-like 6 [Vigna angularis]
MGWTREENRRFEDALAVHGPDDPNRWQHVANAVGGKSVEEVKMHYEILQEDVIRIEHDQIPLPRYRGAGINGRQIDNEQRRKSLLLQTPKLVKSFVEVSLDQG